MGLAGGLNTYAYVLDNPPRYIDTLGLWFIDINFTGGTGGWGRTGGVQIGPSGLYVYAGGGVGDGAGASVTWNSGNPSPGWSSNVTVSGGDVLGGAVTGGIDSNGQGTINVGGSFGVGSGIATTSTYTYPLWQPHKAKPPCP